MTQGFLHPAGPGLRLALLMALASLAAITARTHAIQLMLQVGMTARVRLYWLLYMHVNWLV